MNTAVEDKMEILNPPPNVVRAKARKLTLLVMLVSFMATALLQHVAQTRHHELVKNTGSDANISNLNSFSLALLLGGLRGPLVMMLWMSSESQKMDKDLEDFDSKIELIRLLQPEFDSVHLFQMWNKAYNVSVQMANKTNKYITILDGIEYGMKTASQKKDNINILSEIGKMYFDKLGSSQEKGYYADRARHETLPDVKVTVPANRLKDFEQALNNAGVEPARSEVLIARAKQIGYVAINKLIYDSLKASFTGPEISYAVTETSPYLNGKRVRLDTMLDINGNILPNFLAPETEPHSSDPNTGESNDGSQLQYLKQFQPFPYGLPPMAIGWNYYKRSEVLRWSNNQKHIQISDLVVDDRPAVNLKWWVDAEWENGRRLELQAFDVKLSRARDTADERAAMELPAAEISLTAPIANTAALKQAIYHYDLTPKLVDVASKEFARHQQRYANSDFLSYRDGIIAVRALSLADRDYLLSMLATQKISKDGMVFGSAAATQPSFDPLKADLVTLKNSAIANYQNAATMWELVMLKHYVSNEVITNIMKNPALAKLFPPGLNSNNIDISGPNALNANQVELLAINVMTFLKQFPQFDTDPDRFEAVRSLNRIAKRLMILDPTNSGKLTK